MRKAEEIADWVYWCTGVFFVLVCVMPSIVIALIGLFTGTLPSDAERGIWGYGPGYPAFNPQTWLFFIPAIASLLLVLWTIPLPLRSFPGLSRNALTWWCGIAFWWSLGLGVAFNGAPGIGNEGFFASLVFLLAWLISLIRQVLGWVKLVPRSWRESAPRKRRVRKKSGAPTRKASVV